MKYLRERARNLLADQMAAKGPAWANTAGSIRAGYENVWITVALDAMVPLLLRSGDAEDEADSESVRA